MAPLTWIRKITDQIPSLNGIPLFGHSLPFNWEEFSKQMAEALEIDEIHIQPQEQRFLTADEILEGLSEDLIIVPVSITPLGNVHWMMGRKDVDKLTSWLLKPISKTRAISSEILQEGFYRYLLLETLNCAQSEEPFKELTLQLGEEEESLERAFCIDIKIDCEGQTVWGRLAIPDEFRKKWVAHFSMKPTEYIPKPIAKKIPLVIGVKTGSVILSQEEWKSVQIGDFILLDRKNESGFAQLMLKKTVLFSANLMENKIEITDYAPVTETKKEPMFEDEEIPQDTNNEELTNIKDVPVELTIEIARLELSLDHLMNLSPGETLELPIHPDQGVSLVINGQKVGKAELIYLGEKLGIRVSEIG